ncbi:MAG: 4Fe-4S cluster-binding domain-containing protein [Treponema sp.]|nr:4Fe-4S cluster-binding domain-containing protein [Treponema sp.]
MQKHTFSPTEIIFSATTECNLHCKHCFVSRNKQQLDIQTAINFLKSCTQEASNLPAIEKIGFSGGEPFLYLDFILELTKAAIKQDLLFDQIMTNGDWWQNEQQLKETLQKVYDAGYDGKIGLSWDALHGQDTERMLTFIEAVQEIFGEESINIQRVEDKGGESLPLARTSLLATPSSGGIEEEVEHQHKNEQSELSVPRNAPDIPIFTLPQTFPSENEKAWQSKHWFKEDWCQGPGNILYVHANGNIAPCCGFANENSELFIGKITDSYETILKNAQNNKMVQLCFEKGLSRYKHTAIKILKSQGKKLPGKCGDICSFCDFVCKLERQK